MTSPLHRDQAVGVLQARLVRTGPSATFAGSFFPEKLASLPAVGVRFRCLLCVIGAGRFWNLLICKRQPLRKPRGHVGCFTHEA